MIRAKLLLDQTYDEGRRGLSSKIGSFYNLMVFVCSRWDIFSPKSWRVNLEGTRVALLPSSVQPSLLGVLQRNCWSFGLLSLRGRHPRPPTATQTALFLESPSRTLCPPSCNQAVVEAHYYVPRGSFPL